jgi:hypothetical protein
MIAGSSPDKHTETTRSIEKPTLSVTQPEKIASLLDTLNIIEQMSERIGEDRSGDMGSAGGQAGTGGQAAQQKQISPRDQAIANLPSQEIMQQKLTKRIEEEVRNLRRQIRAIPSASKPGAAFKLNKLYARIRRLNGLLAELLEASYEVLRRMFIRIFIDEQPIL